MPIYEFECGGCGNVSEQIYKKPEPKDTDFIWCVRCQKAVLHFKRVSQCSFQLKGKGWAKDGYVNPTPGMPSGDKFIEQYRKEINDPEHPRKVGDILRKNRQGDDLSDIGNPNFDLNAARNSKSESGSS